MQFLEIDDVVSCRWFVAYVAQPGVDVPGCALAVTSGDRHRSFIRHHVATGKDSGSARHHVLINDDRAISLELKTGNVLHEAGIHVLAESHDQ